MINHEYCDHCANTGIDRRYNYCECPAGIIVKCNDRTARERESAAGWARAHDLIQSIMG